MFNYRLLPLVFALSFLTEMHVGESCNNSFASYFSGSFLVNSSCFDTLYNATVNATALNSISIYKISKRLNCDYVWYLNAQVYQDTFLKFKIQDTIIDTIVTISDTIINGLDTIICEADTFGINYFVDGNGVELKDSSDSLKFELTYTLTEKGVPPLVCKDVYSRKL